MKPVGVPNSPAPAKTEALFVRIDASSMLGEPDFAANIPESVRNLGNALLDDCAESDSLPKTAATAGAFIALETIGAFRIPPIVSAYISMRVMRETGSPIETAGAAGVIFASWVGMAGAVINTAANRFPKTVDSISENYPAPIKHFSDSLPGLHAEKEVPVQRPFVRRIGKFALDHSRRGMTAFGVGILPYLGIAKMEDQTKPERHRLAAKLSAETGLLATLIAGGTAEVIGQLNESNPALAERIQSETGNAKLWIIAAGVLMSGEWLKNRFGHKLRRHPHEETPKILVNAEAVSPV